MTGREFDVKHYWYSISSNRFQIKILVYDEWQLYETSQKKNHGEEDNE